MCGIAGLLDHGWSGTDEELARLARAMAAPLAHRGPDDEGTWSDAEAGIAFGHRRLAVIDLSEAGHQPMVSADGRWVASYNGECYNAAELRGALPDRGRSLKGHCDTEVVVEAVAAWGLRPTLERLDAMFALALWDRRDHVLHLVRDRLGEKPLYYAVHGSVVLFGSELSALVAYPRFNREIDRRALALLLRLNYIPAPLTIYKDARKLAAGTLVSVRPDRGGWPQPEVWWDFPAAARTAMEARSPDGDDEAALEQLEAVLAGSVARRMVADVPVGTFLSGGIDSTLVTALAQKNTTATVRTFTVGFDGRGRDEADHAEAVARHLGTAHTRIDLTADDALKLVPQLGRYYDEPFADPSQLPTLLMCREARRHVTVALSGDGGDEAFGGYRRYTAGSVLSRRLQPVPRGVRRAAAGALKVVPGAVWDGIERGAQRLRPERVGTDLGARAQKLARLVSAESSREVYMSLVSAWDDAETVVVRAPDAQWSGPPALPGLVATTAEEMMAWDTLSTLPDEMLVKVDRASMAFSLEVRPPLVDHKVVEAAWALPASLRIRGGVGKRALRLLVERHVPRQLVDRPKTGFDPPLGEWLRGPLREWADDHLALSRLREEGFLDPAAVRASWDAHQAGRPGLEYALWAVLVFEAWLDETRGARGTRTMS
jgi:asparagine synthase (glutamine-hydrolysing)